MRLTMIALILATAHLSAASPIQGDGKSLQELFRTAGKSVAAVKVYDTNGELRAEGTGFVAAPFLNTPKTRYIVTNRHVIRGAAKLVAEFPDGSSIPLDKIAAEDIRNDLVVLSGERLPETAVALELTRQLPEVGQRVAVIGNPAGLSQSLSDGIVASIRELPPFSSVVQITAPISPGSSGSPVFTLDGKVIGIASLQYTNGQNLNFAIPASRLGSLKPDAGISLQEWIGEIARGSRAVNPPDKAAPPRTPLLPENINTFEYWLDIAEKETAKLDRTYRAELFLGLADSWRDAGQNLKVRELLDKANTNPSLVDDFTGRIINLYCDVGDYQAAKLFVMSRVSSMRNFPSPVRERIAIEYYGWILKRASIDQEKREEYLETYQTIEGLKNSVPQPTGIVNERFPQQSDRAVVLGEFAVLMAEVGEEKAAEGAVLELKNMGGGSAIINTRLSDYSYALIAHLLVQRRLYDAEKLWGSLEASAPPPAILRERYAPDRDLRVIADRARAQIGRTAFELGANEEFARFRAWVEDRLRQGQQIAESDMVVDTLLLANEMDLALRVAQISGGPVASIIKRYAELGDRRRAVQLLALIPTTPLRAEAALSLAELAYESGDLKIFDAMMGQFENIVQDRWRSGRTPNLLNDNNWPTTDRIAVMVRFGTLKARSNPIEDVWVWWNTLPVELAEHRIAIAIGISHQLVLTKQR